MRSRWDPDSRDGALARERRPPVGIARERETRTVGAAPRQREYRPLSQSRMARPLGVPAGNIPMLCRDGRGVQEEPIMWVFAGGGSNRASSADGGRNARLEVLA